MLPDFESTGYLPEGIHPCTLDEFFKKFMNTPWRSKFKQGLMQLIYDLNSIGVSTIYIDGSFVTNKRLPNDMDICWEDTGIDYTAAQTMHPILFDWKFPRKKQQSKYGADVFPARLYEGGSKLYFLDFFQNIKYSSERKGIVKIHI